jgi:hypothetical protein
MEDLIGVAEASQILGITVVSVHQRIKSHSIKPVGKLGQAYALSRQAIEKLRDELKREAYR